jgi:transposase
LARKDIIMLSQEELRRLHVLTKVIEKRLKQKEAASILGVSTRQIRRLVKRIEKAGEAGIVHQSRGKSSNRKIPEKTKSMIIELYRKEYGDFGPTMAAEKLLERHNLQISDETLRIWLIETGDWKVKRKKKQHRQWRERKHHYGEMVQIDGSHHDWFEARGPVCVLMGYIDDATGNVFGKFYEYEGTIPAMDSFRRYIRKNGIPMSIYLDKHTTYKSRVKEPLYYGVTQKESLSQFERAMKELGVRVIHAHSPQAKGRVERLFRTFQDRVVKEMRLKGIKNIEEGNKFLQYYLPIYNRRFAVKAKEKESMHRKVTKGLDLDKVLCLKTERTLRNDFTVAHKGLLYQVIESTDAKKVTVQKRINGSVHIMYKDKRLKFKEISERPVKESQRTLMAMPRKKYIPPVNHPWRSFKLKSQLRKTGS